MKKSTSRRKTTKLPAPQIHLDVMSLEDNKNLSSSVLMGLTSEQQDYITKLEEEQEEEKINNI